MTNVDRNLGVSEPWGRATEKEIEDLKKRLRKLEGGRKVQAKTQSILADLVAKASVQDQLLQSQIDAQDIVTYADGPPDLGINEPDDSDVSEEDPGPVTGDEVDFDPGTDNDDDDDAGVPWEPDDGTPPEPEYRWVQEDPLRGVIEGEWVLVDGVWEPRHVGSDYVADGAIIRDKIEQAVLDDIDEANSNANEAVIAANGKNTIYRGPNSPTPPSNGFNEGDTWFDTSGGNTSIKSWSGSAWTVQEVGTESLAVGAITAESGIIASLDAGVISAGTLDADRIGANTITGSKILVGSVPGDRLEDGSITGTLIEDGAITTGKIAADAIEADHIKANAITAPKIGAGAVTARTLNVIAEENNRRLSILPDGVRLWGDVEAGGDPAIAITTTGAEYISITDGSDTVIGLDQSGTVTAQNLTVADDILLGALETDSALSQVIEDAPQGVIARYERNVSGETLNANSSTDGRMEFLEVEVDLYEGRVYRWDFDPLGVAMNYLSRAYIYAYFTTDGSKPTFDSDYRVLAYHIKRSEGHSSGDNIQMDGFRYFIPTSDLLGMRIMVGMRHNYGGTSTSALPSLRISTLSGMNAARFTITDLGARTYGDLGADRTRKVHPTSPTGGSSGSGGSDPAPKKTYTKTYNSTGGASYKSSGGRITTAPYAGRVTQGGGALGPHGEIHGAWFFGSPWSSDISGATIKKVELYITNQHSYSNAGLSARVHRHTNSNSSAPNTFTSGSLSNLKSFSFSKGQGKWVDVTSIFTSTTRGFGLKYSGTAQYGYFSNSARVRITYEK